MTCKLSVPSRFLVLLPNEPDVNTLSIRITDETERQRLIGLLEKINSNSEHGIIARTNAEDSSEEDLVRDYKFLQKLWRVVSQRIKDGQFKQLVYHEFDLPVRVVRDFISDKVRTIKTDSHEVYTKLNKFIVDYVPEWQGQLIHYQEVRPIFDYHNIDDEINRAFRQFVPLKSGGNLIIDQNEAMTTIDVNTGKFIGFKNQEETIFRTNLEAVIEENGRPQPGTVMAIVAHLRIVLVQMMRISGLEEATGTGRGEDAHFLQRFRQLVEGHFRDHWPVARYARVLGITADRLHAICTRELGRNPKALIAERLAREAAMALERSTLSIEQLSHSLGFRDPAHFSHFHKRMTGLAPGKFRKMLGSAANTGEFSPPNFADWP